MPTVKVKPRTMEEYLAGANAGQRAALEKLRQTIRAVAPEAEECLSYGLAAFRLRGRALVAFGAWANHCALYPMSSATVKAFQNQLRRFETSKGTIRFSADQPLPTALVKKLVRARIVEHAAHRSLSQRSGELRLRADRAYKRPAPLLSRRTKVRRAPRASRHGKWIQTTKDTNLNRRNP